jgi:hypothetical protein
LRVCYFVAPSRQRGRVCNLLYNCFWAFPEQSLFGRCPAELRPYFTVSSETPPTWRARSPYLYPPGTGWPSYTPGHWVCTLYVSTNIDHLQMSVKLLVKLPYSRTLAHRHIDKWGYLRNWTYGRRRTSFVRHFRDTLRRP